MKITRIWLMLTWAALCASAALAATITVLVQKTTVRKRPQFYAPVLAAAKLGDKFEAEGPAEGWYKTSVGYVHESAVTANKIKISAGSTTASGPATADEITLAGKGFNSQVEKSYSAQDTTANFAAVDAMERRSVSDAAVLEFLRKGGLIPREDAQ